MTAVRIKKIVKASGLSESKVKKLVEEKKEEAAGLLTDHGALYALEKEYGISSSEEALEITEIEKLKPNMQSVNVFGVIKEVSSPREYKTAKREGKYARLGLKDNSGESTVVLWDKNASLVESEGFKIGSRVLIRNVYTKEGLNKNVEIHAGNLAKITLNPGNMQAEKLPEVIENVKKVNEIKENGIFSVYGRIKNIYPKTEFKRNDGSTGKVSSIIVEDKTGKIRIVFWDKAIEKLAEFSEGDTIKIENGEAKANERGIELHVNRGRILRSDVKLELPIADESKTAKIAQIETGAQSVNVNARIIRMLPIKEFTNQKGAGRLASLILADETGFVRLVLWNEKSDFVKDVNEGDTIAVRNAYVKTGISGETELHVSRSGRVSKNPEGVDMPIASSLLEKHAFSKKIYQLRPDDRNVVINGKIDSVDEGPVVFQICNECGARIQNVAGEWICDLCGEVTPTYSLNIACNVSDETGEIRALFYRGVAEQLSGMSIADVMNIIGKAGDEYAPLKEIREIVLKKNVSVIGNVRYNDYFDRLELIASSVSQSSRPTVIKEGESSDNSDEEANIEEINIDE